MSLDYPMNKNLDGQLVAALKNFKINPIATDPAGPELVEGILWYVEDVQKWKYFDGTLLRTLGEGSGRKRGNYDASTGVIPDATSVTIDPTIPIANGDYFVVTVAGTLTGLIGEEELEVGDLLYANIDAPAAATDFYAVQTNIQLADNPLEAELLLGQDILAGAITSFTPTLFNTITSIEIVDGSEGTSLTDSVAIHYTLDLATGNYGTANVETLVDILGANISIQGFSA